MIELTSAAASHLHEHEIDAVLEHLGPQDPVTVQAGTVAICESTGHVLLHPSDGAAPKIIGDVPDLMPEPRPVAATVANANVAGLDLAHDRIDDLRRNVTASLSSMASKGYELERALERALERISTLEGMAHEHEAPVA